MNLEQLCLAAVSHGASDLILHEDAVPVARINGAMHALSEEFVPAGVFEDLWTACHAPADVMDFDSALRTADNARFRVNLLRQLGRRAAVLRHIRAEVPDFATLGLPVDVITPWLSRRSGIVLVTGPTASGKSTTLAACVEFINQTASRHIVTIEDPVEYLFTDVQSRFTQRDVGIDTASFATGLRQALRQAPDVILIGEIRDAPSAMTAIQASETGHLILATVHGSGSGDAIERISQLLPADERALLGKVFATQLLGVVAQRLLPATNGGLVLAVEYFVNEGVTRKFIEEARLGELREFIGRSDGTAALSLMGSVARLCRDGVITEDVAKNSVDSPTELLRALRGISSQSLRR